ncbi:12-oxophytodienoate reductase [Pseudomonas sp. A-R-19]|jgi:2,4-dienoyl-CoA reductase-like NADH-dependent reductase (Old Yellow Enzyme family)|uniref:oxidoreductase n=1 Tax=Pseudomonas sp. A-R-19 TaxID=2832403 RepID=UPI001CBF5B04|nr:12-oxophytodienoate reductase [Pseudomonas sp. A-R-19]
MTVALGSPSLSRLQPLFTAFRLGSLVLPNRIVMAPMTRCSAVDGVPGEGVASYYRQRAENGVGLIISEGIGVDHAAALGTGTLGESNLPVLHGAKPVARWKAIVDQVHGAGGRIFAQLWHQGPVRMPGTGPHPDAPSCRPSGRWGPLAGNTSATAQYLAEVRRQTPAMSESAIADVIAAYGRTTANARAAGFDGLAIHGAHGYLIDSFLWGVTNVRNDAWGGSLRARTRFACEVIKEVRRAGGGLPVVFRFSQWKLQDYDARLVDTPAGLEHLLEPLAEAGVDVFDASTRQFHLPAFAGSQRTLAGWTRHLSGLPVMAVGGVGLDRELKDSLLEDVLAADNAQIAARAIEQGEFDLIGVGRALLADPDWVGKLRSGALLPDFRSSLFAGEPVQP